MSYHEYTVSRKLVAQNPPFYALIMAAMRKADPANQAALILVFRDQWDELEARYRDPGGYLPGEAVPFTDPGDILRTVLSSVDAALSLTFTAGADAAMVLDTVNQVVDVAITALTWARPPTAAWLPPRRPRPGGHHSPGSPQGGACHAECRSREIGALGGHRDPVPGP